MLEGALELYWYSVELNALFALHVIFHRQSSIEEVTTKHLNECGEEGLRMQALAFEKLDEANSFNFNIEGSSIFILC